MVSWDTRVGSARFDSVFPNGRSRRRPIFEWGSVQSAQLISTQTRDVADEHNEREQALRSLPLPYSLALRLRDAGVAPEVICEYVGVEEASLAGVLRIAEAKLAAVRGAHEVNGSQGRFTEAAGRQSSVG
jgi:hypothetical protein